MRLPATNIASLLLAALLLAALLLAATVSRCMAKDEPAVDFRSTIQPILESACVRCHDEKTPEGELRLDSREAAIKGGENGTSLVPGKPEKSPFYTTMVLKAGHDDIMPPEDPPLARSQRDLIKTWIAQGARWPAKAKLKPQPRIYFSKHVQPILEQNCVACHKGGDSDSEYNLSTQKTAFAEGDEGMPIVPFQSEKSTLYTLTILEKDADELMPPEDKGGPLKKDMTERLRLWISQGAIWPEGLTLTVKAKSSIGPPSPDNRQLLEKIHALIAKRDKESQGAKMANYSSKVPKTGAAYHMLAIRGGQFLMGSPASEAKRRPTEGPQVKVKVDPFWMGKFEVTWDEYEPYMITKADRGKHGGRTDYDPKLHGIADAVSQPTKPYVEMSFGMGQKGYPAISMTQHAANKYCQWLSAQTGHFYRLPTEAEWEYACRAGTTTAYSFGDDASKLDQYAWHYDNSNEKYQKVGLKKPNPWGLHDMHGNVMEWTADQYAADYFKRIKDSPTNPLVRPAKLYPRSIRGGGWDDDPEQLRSAYRRGSQADWKSQDPQLPKSVWYHTNALWLGFRIVRPMKTPSLEEVDFYWNSATNKR